MGSTRTDWWIPVVFVPIYFSKIGDDKCMELAYGCHLLVWCFWRPLHQLSKLLPCRDLRGYLVGVHCGGCCISKEDDVLDSPSCSQQLENLFSSQESVKGLEAPSVVIIWNTFGYLWQKYILKIEIGVFLQIFWQCFVMRNKGSALAGTKRWAPGHYVYSR